MVMRRSANGAIAGALGAALWAAQQPLDKRVFGSRYDDLELLGKGVTRGPAWPVVGLLLHVQNGAAFGALYAQAKPFLPGPPLVRGLLAALAQNFASWPLGRLTDRHHPARRELPKLEGNRRGLAQATWRHALFGVTLAALEHRLNTGLAAEPPATPVSWNGHPEVEVAPVGVA